MSEYRQPIPARVYNASKGGHVAGAADIIDDRLNENQEDINKDTYRKSETYSKDETNNIISHTPETDVVVLSLEEGETAFDVLNEVPLEDRPNNVFRIRNVANTHYDEYGWTGTVWALLASKDYGIDLAPTPDSTNWLASGAIYNYLEDLINDNVQDYKFALTDKYGNAIAAVDASDNFKVFLNVILTTINNVPAPKVVTTEYLKVAYLDESDNIIIGIDKDDNLVSGLWDLSSLRKYGTPDPEDIRLGKNTDIYKRNIDKDAVLTNDAYYSEGESLKKRWQGLVLTDSHLNNQSVLNWKDAGDAFSSVDCLIHLGDMTDSLGPDDANDGFWNGFIPSLSKPTYIAIGNHDVGTNQPIVSKSRDDEDMYNQFVLPLINKGFISAEEYTDGKCYYYHDFPNRKVRLIVLYPFENPTAFDEDLWLPVTYDSSYQSLKTATAYPVNTIVNVDGYIKHSFKALDDITVYELTQYTYLDLHLFDSEHWELVTYDSSKTFAKNGGTYYADDVVNVRGYGDHSIRCKLQVKLESRGENGSQSRGSILYPRYKTYRYCAWFSTEQLQWLCQTLDGAGELGYTCVIACHYNVLGPHEQVDCRFNNPYHGSYPPYTHLGLQSVIADIVNAYQNGESVDLSVNAVPRTESYVIVKGGKYYDASGPEGYVAPEGTTKYIDDVNGMESSVSYSFEHSGDVLFLAGHSHSDGLLHSTKEGYNQTCVAFLAGVVQNVANKDIIRATDDSKFMDILTAVTIDGSDTETDGDAKSVHLTRIGADVTRRVGSDGRLIRKDNEIINY